MLLSISSLDGNLNKNSTAFRKNKEPELVDIKRTPEYEIRTYNVEASKNKKWGVGIASFFIPGLGQAINGSWGKGIGFFLGSVIVPGILGAAPLLSVIKDAKNETKGHPKFTKTLVASYILAILASIGIRIWSIVDAVKNAKTELQQAIHIRQGESPVRIINANV